MSEKVWSPFEPEFPESGNGLSVLADFASELAATRGATQGPRQERRYRVLQAAALAANGRNATRRDGRSTSPPCTCSPTWPSKVGTFGSTRPRSKSADQRTAPDDSDETRDRIRGQLHAERDEQLRQPATRSFVRSMEARQLFGEQFVSIFSLMSDGRELEPKLRAIREAATEDERLELASAAIKPYLQFIRGEERCSWTGYRLVDIWRYFRHTWANPYKSVPGRSIMVLVRDAAALAILSSGSPP